MKTFICSYQGETTYLVAGKRYDVRHHAHDDGHYNGDYYERGILPALGTVRRASIGDYPPPEVMAEFPGYVAARYNAEQNCIEYLDNIQPDIMPDPAWPCGFVATIAPNKETTL